MFILQLLLHLQSIFKLVICCTVNTIHNFISSTRSSHLQILDAVGHTWNSPEGIGLGLGNGLQCENLV